LYRLIDGNKAVSTTLSYLEVYNETIRDLLVDQTFPLNLLEDDQAQEVRVPKLSHHTPNTIHEIMPLLIKGNANRSLAPTDANAVSSRSHAVLQVHVKHVRHEGTKEVITRAVLSIVDLAGSERASATRNRGVRLHEGAKINQSLLALGNVINSLAKISEGAQGIHVPFRDSKLTRLLKYSLSGSCRVVMIACVSPHPQHLEETQNTLQYANRAKQIRVKTTSNKEQVERSVTEYKKIIDDMGVELTALKEKVKRLELENERLRLQASLERMESSTVDKSPIVNTPKLSRSVSIRSVHAYSLRSRPTSHSSPQTTPPQTVTPTTPEAEMEDLWKKLDKTKLDSIPFIPIVDSNWEFIGAMRSPVSSKRRARRSMLPIWKSR
jgi:hypothetical protein